MQEADIDSAATLLLSPLPVSAAMIGVQVSIDQASARTSR